MLFYLNQPERGSARFIAWQYDSKGVHSVRSAYKLHVQIGKQASQGGVGSSTSGAGNPNYCSDNSWKRLWKLPGPRNIQMFAWRLKHESLALRTNLKRRGIPVADTKCLFCECADEDVGHLFIKCKSVKVVWRELAMEKQRLELEEISSVHEMLDYLWGLEETKCMHILTFWWHWWSSKNKLREGELSASALEVARRTRSNFLSICRYLLQCQKPVVGINEGHQRKT